jgi:thiamine-monophosphate kinase
LTVAEFELIAAIRSALGRRGERVLRASGDDAALVRVDGVSATSVDAFVEGVHFRLATTSLGDLGHKCIAAALSDLAAMGASAGEAYLALGLPPSLGEREVLELVAGAERLAEATGTTICGGDLTAADELFVVVTAVGYAQREDALVTRAGAGTGELVGVTGRLGGAGAGLILLERKEHGLPVDVGESLIDRQRRPLPRLAAGRALAAAGVTAMIDLSDGIASDAARLAEESGVELEIELARLPLDEGVDQVAASIGRSGFELAASAGEDYELLFTAAPAAREEIERIAEASDTPVSWVGQTLAGEGVRLLDESGEPRLLEGWDHLARRSSSPRREQA